MVFMVPKSTHITDPVCTARQHSRTVFRRKRPPEKRTLTFFVCSFCRREAGRRDLWRRWGRWSCTLSWWSLWSCMLSWWGRWSCTLSWWGRWSCTLSWWGWRSCTLSWWGRRSCTLSWWGRWLWHLCRRRRSSRSFFELLHEPSTTLSLLLTFSLLTLLLLFPPLTLLLTFTLLLLLSFIVFLHLLLWPLSLRCHACQERERTWFVT